MLEGAIEPKAIGKHAKKLGFPAIAITDRNGLYGVMPFEDEARSNGVQPIIGMLLAIARPDSIAQGGFVRDWLALYAQDDAGYVNLCRLASMAHLDRPEAHDAHVSFEQLTGLTGGLLALTGGGEGALARMFADGSMTRHCRIAPGCNPCFRSACISSLAAATMQLKRPQRRR